MAEQCLSAPITPESFAAFTASLYGAADLYGDQEVYLCAASCIGRLPSGENDWRQHFFRYPRQIPAAAAWLRAEAERGRDCYMSAHLLTAKSRAKRNAAPIWTLWADLDGAELPPALPPPTMIVETSPGRCHPYWRLRRPMLPYQAEGLTRRIAHATDADASGFDLSQMLRVPGTFHLKGVEEGRVHDVAIIYQHDAAYDPDELDRALPLIPETERAADRAEITGAAIAGDEPPIVLEGEALERWRGERFTPGGKGPRGEDRSHSLCRIARDLYDAGANRWLIVVALADRDDRLGWHKETNRADRTERYNKIVDMLEASGRNRPRRMAVPAAGVGEVARLRRENAELTSLVERLRGRLRLADQQLEIYRNPGLGSARPVAAALVEVYQYEPAARTDRPEGWRVPLAKLAEKTGYSEDACSRQLKQLSTFTLPDGTPLLHRKVVTTQNADREPRQEVWTGPGVEPAAFGEAAARIAPPERKPWGGKPDRGVCATHPEDGVIERRETFKVLSYECAVCHEPIGESRRKQILRPKQRWLPEIPDPPRCPQDAGTTTGDQGDGLSGTRAGILRARSAESKTLGQRIHQAALITDEDAPPGTVAGAWKRGEAFPDRYTDTSLGRDP